jgi:broad specificity phosphatase PhoE
LKRLLMVRHAPTRATRSAAFPVDEPLDDRGLAAARLLADAVPRRARVVASPSRRCVETARAAGRRCDTDALLAECDFGDWRGRTLSEIEEADPDGVRSWMTSADAAPHGGESLTGLYQRVSGWLDAQAQNDGQVVAITHAGVVRAAVVHALGAPIDAFWRLDVAPLSVTELHAHAGRWTVTRLNQEVAC